MARLKLYGQSAAIEIHDIASKSGQYQTVMVEAAFRTKDGSSWDWPTKSVLAPSEADLSPFIGVMLRQQAGYQCKTKSGYLEIRWQEDKFPKYPLLLRLHQNGNEYQVPVQLGMIPALANVFLQAGSRNLGLSFQDYLMLIKAM
jgi:hypothetical protein